MGRKKPTYEVDASITDLFGEDEVVVSATEVGQPKTLPVRQEVPAAVAPATTVAPKVLATTKPDGPGPRMLDCGHWDWSSEEDQATARADGHCCVGGKQRRPPSYRDLKGSYRRPLPTWLRRTRDKTSGDCCDDAGFYIGGVQNDCRLIRPPNEWCVGHRPASTSEAFVEEEPGDDASTDGPKKMTHKERQMLAKKKAQR